ncbi:MAG TPA: urease accessory protein UreE [Devosiaceae bacterium]|nr:urease accessory protein UreE [Devosiaceae bacterium]
MFRVTAHLPAATAKGVPFDSLTLAHDQRRLRRKLLTLPKGEEILVDFPEPVTLGHGDRLRLEDERLVGIIAADEPVYEIRGRDAAHIARLAWHIGNRHLPAQIEKSRIIIGRDRIIRDMLLGLGATVTETVEHFSPEHGAYQHGHGEQPHALSAR